MSRIVYALLATLTCLVLLFGYRTSTEVVLPTAVAPAPSGNGSTRSSGPAGSSGSSGTSGTGGGTGAPSSGLHDGTYQGSTVATQWGPVQVQITVSGGRITDAQTLQQPSGNGTDERINGYAIPVLDGEVLDAQSAQIDMVSGATVTSTGYLGSLQSAIDQAHG
ncbi:FMN-binding protein [Promicromonospora sp. NPDC019610]|uniref:FMN-binding protein n=1 Tax=Promicromonospora sp. NPDC019610 TaxID=3364405 RepID=UPI0037A1A3D2